MNVEKFKKLEYDDPEPVEKENTHRMTSVHDGDRKCKVRKIWLKQEPWYNPFSRMHKMDMDFRKKLKMLDNKVNRLEIRKRKQRAIKKLWNSFEAINNSPDGTPGLILPA
jgi:hypothetical protein